MIIKSVIRGGYRSAADYMKEQGKNEKTRLIELSDPSAKNLDDAFHNMWVVASNTKCTKPLHHISINPAMGERLTDEQLMKIVEHAEEIYGYKMFHHQRVIVEHVKDGRQHFHVIWNRVSLMTGRPVWPGMHWNKSKQICREMEKALGIKSPSPRKNKNARGKRNIRNRKSVRTRRPVRRRQQLPAKQALSLNRGMLAQPKVVFYKPQPVQKPTTFMPYRPRKGWPVQAIIDWEVWGHRNPRRFFALWPELSKT